MNVDDEKRLQEYLDGRLSESERSAFELRLKADAQTKDIPVIIFTAREHSRGKQLAREMGAVDYFPKPFEPDELIGIVEEYAAATPA